MTLHFLKVNKIVDKKTRIPNFYYTKAHTEGQTHRDVKTKKRVVSTNCYNAQEEEVNQKSL